jgi:Tannase and feruloyl esterase
MKRWSFVLALSLLSATAQAQITGTVSGPPPEVPPDACPALKTLKLPNTKITRAEQVAAGAFTRPPSPSGLSGAPNAFKKLPAFCRVSATLTPSPDSDIKIEVWMPVKDWNSKFHGQGNGGFAGEIDYGHMADAVAQGYATGGTDTGHAASGIDASWAIGHPEKVADFGYRAIHEMTEKSKAIVAAYYSSSISHAYFAACSDGGREALMEAQRFPADYDGILAGAPANNWTGLLTNAVANLQSLLNNPASYIPASKLPAIADAVNASCDKLDAVADGVITDPRQCSFDPATLLCKQSDSDKCLTAPQIAALKTLYAGTRDSSGKLIFPGYTNGGEDGPGGWAPWITGPAPGKSLMAAFGIGYFANMVYGDPKWDFKTFKVDQGFKAAIDKTSRMLDSTDPDLKPFIDRGGKLILYHGWNDPAISALNTINYYEEVENTTGKDKTESSVRLYMAPGVQHCGGGPGADSFGQFDWTPGEPPNDPQHSLYGALEDWVEKNVAPAAIVATKFTGEGASRRATMTRQLCPYPQTAKYRGSGDPNDAFSYTCSAK